MRIPVKLKPEKLVSKDQTRPVLASLYLRIVGEGDDRKGFLEGTDSYKLARVPVEINDEDTEGFVPVDAILAARKLKVDEIGCNGGIEINGGPAGSVAFPRADLGKFPSPDQLMPAEESLYSFKIGLNPRLLMDLAEGMGAETITLQFCAHKEYKPGISGGAGETTEDVSRPSHLRPMVVKPLHTRGDASPDAIGILMPIRCPDA